MYAVSNLIVVVEISRFEIGDRDRGGWAKTGCGRKLGARAYSHLLYISQTRQHTGHLA
jgi:hypothetical protein